MRPQVGEEMSRQPSLPSLTIEGTLVRTSRLTRAEHTTRTIVPPRSVSRAHDQATTSPILNDHKQTYQSDLLTRPRSFRDAGLARLAAVIW
jgi:hypothetical protein